MWRCRSGGNNARASWLGRFLWDDSMLWWISCCRTTGNPGGSPWVGAEVPAGGGDASGVSPGCQPRCLLTAPREPGAALGVREPSVRCPGEGRNSGGTGRGHVRASSLHAGGPWPRWSCQAGQEGWTAPLSSAGKGPKGFLYGLDGCPRVWRMVCSSFPTEARHVLDLELGFPCKIPQILSGIVSCSLHFPENKT